VSQSPANDNRRADVAAQRPGERIVVGVDGSSGSQAALRWALVEAATQKVPLRAVMCSAPTSGSRTDELDGSAPNQDSTRPNQDSTRPNQDSTRLDALLAEATAAPGAAVAVTASVIRGHPRRCCLTPSPMRTFSWSGVAVMAEQSGR